MADQPYLERIIAIMRENSCEVQVVATGRLLGGPCGKGTRREERTREDRSRENESVAAVI